MTPRSAPPPSHTLPETPILYHSTCREPSFLLQPLAKHAILFSPLICAAKPLHSISKTLPHAQQPVPQTLAAFPSDAVARAKEYLADLSSLGAYTDSRGSCLVRSQVRPDPGRAPPSPRSHASFGAPPEFCCDSLSLLGARQVAEWLLKRDGLASSPERIFLTDGAPP